MSPRRPLRWTKFSFLLALASLAAAQALPTVRLLQELVRAPYVDHPQTVFFPLFCTFLLACCVIGLILDAGMDLLTPKPVVVLLVLLASLPWARVDPWKEEGLVSRDGGAQMRWAAARLRELASRELETLGVMPAGPSLEREIRSQLSRTSYRSRALSRLPLHVVVLERRQGPVLTRQSDDPPGTLYLAVAEGGRVGWVTALVLGREGPELQREQGNIKIHPIFDAGAAGLRDVSPSLAKEVFRAAR